MRKEISDEPLTLVAGGYEGTGTTLSWLLERMTPIPRCWLGSARKP